MLLKEYRLRFLDSVLDLLWSQWTTLGVSGSISFAKNWIIDPEALILFTCSIGRYEARVFDSMLEWIRIHERLLNVQRLKTISKKEQFIGRNLLPVIAELFRKPKTASKWQRLSDRMNEYREEDEPLFLLKDGSPHPSVGEIDVVFKRSGYQRSEFRFRNTAQTFNPNRQANLIMKLRALLGVNSRCEVFAYILTHDEANPREIAQATYYYPRTIYNTLSEMLLSGKLRRKEKGREKLYSIRGNAWGDFFWSSGKAAGWTNWPAAFKALEMIWQRIDNPEVRNVNSLLAASEIKLAIHEAMSRLQQVIPNYFWTVDVHPSGTDLDLETLISFIDELIRYLHYGENIRHQG